MKHLSLKLKVSIIVAAATLLLTALLTVLSYREYSTVVDEHYNTLAMDIAKTAASLVDGDQVAFSPAMEKNRAQESRHMAPLTASIQKAPRSSSPA